MSCPLIVTPWLTVAAAAAECNKIMLYTFITSWLIFLTRHQLTFCNLISRLSCFSVIVYLFTQQSARACLLVWLVMKPCWFFFLFFVVPSKSYSSKRKYVPFFTTKSIGRAVEGNRGNIFSYCTILLAHSRGRPNACVCVCVISAQRESLLLIWFIAASRSWHRTERKIANKESLFPSKSTTCNIFPPCSATSS